MDDAEQMAGRFRTLREAHRLKAVEVAGRSGLDPSLISRLESEREPRDPRLSTFRGLARAYGVTPGDVVNYVCGETPPAPDAPPVVVIVEQLDRLQLPEYIRTSVIGLVTGEAGTEPS